MKMNTKNLMVSFMATAIALFLVATASAFTVSGDLTDNEVLEIDGIVVDGSDVSVIAGETIVIQTFFDAEEDATNVRVKAEIEGDKLDMDVRTNSFDVEEGKRYVKTLKLKVPFDLRDELSDDFELSIKVWNGDFKSEWEDIVLRVQRPSFNPIIKSISTVNNIEAGETIPVDIVVKNVGYNDLDDLYVIASIEALGLEKTAYFGDLVPLEEGDCLSDSICNAWGTPNEDDEDTVSGRIFLKLPFEVESGVYTLDVKVTNDDVTLEKVKQIAIKNDFETNVFASGNDLWLVNPTNKVMGYRIVAESASVSENVVFVPAGSSKVVKVSPEGEAKVNVFKINGEVVSTVAFSGEAETETVSNSVVILTIILAIIFVVLLVVLIVLITKKPEKADEFGESYY